MYIINKDRLYGLIDFINSTFPNYSLTLEKEWAEEIEVKDTMFGFDYTVHQPVWSLVFRYHEDEDDTEGTIYRNMFLVRFKDYYVLPNDFAERILEILLEIPQDNFSRLFRAIESRRYDEEKEDYEYDPTDYDPIEEERRQKEWWSQYVNAQLTGLGDR